MPGYQKDERILKIGPSSMRAWIGFVQKRPTPNGGIRTFKRETHRLEYVNKEQGGQRERCERTEMPKHSKDVRILRIGPS